MARFYGSVKGNRGEATRCGHARGGLFVTAKTWHGWVSIQLYVGIANTDCIRITAYGRTLYDGPMQDLKDHKSLLQHMANKALEKEFTK